MAYLLECVEKYDIIIFVKILIKVIIETLKGCDSLFNKLLIKSIPYLFLKDTVKTEKIIK